MFNRLYASAYGQDSSSPLSTLLVQPERQRVAPDVVKLPPVRDQYADILKAGERLGAGKSILSTNVENAKGQQS